MSRGATAAPPSAPVGTMVATPRTETPDHRSWSAALMVFLGGAVGTVSRESLDLVTPSDQLMFTTLAINIVGSFALAAVYTLLLARRPAATFGRRVRLVVGTGFMGGFTTYGSFAVATAAAAGQGSVGDAVIYGLGSIVLGVAAALLGRWSVELGSRRTRAAADPEPVATP
ncbi:CrcB family protein [Herbiconiux sp. P15]|uniref:fluoride efflux transporter FluC n=1 Tax=Herbiconiux liukaitaii TaxID=3342799 RepID=UPI0035BA4809